jgi:hypothetical protein
MRHRLARAGSVPLETPSGCGYGPHCRGFQYHCPRPSPIPRLSRTRPLYQTRLQKITRLLKFGRRSKSITSNLIHHSAEAMKMELRLNGSLLQQDIDKFDAMISPLWMKSTWRFLIEHDICVADDLPDLDLIRQHDGLLMEEFDKLGLSKTELCKANVCGMHLQVITIADITEGNSEQITDNAWNGMRALPHTRKYKWAFQPRSPATFW